MKSNEILHALRLIKSKETINFCSKLSSIFCFIQSIKADIKEAAIVESGLTINQYGKLMPLAVITKQYKAHKLNNYTHYDKEMQELQKQIDNLYSEKRNANDLLWKKRKNKDNSKLENEISALETEIKQLTENKETLWNNEQARLETLSFTVEEMIQELNLFAGDRILIETTQGIYSFYVPVDNSFYYELCRLLNIECKIKDVAVDYEKTIVNTITFDATAFKAMATACKFISKDGLRPVMQHVCLAFENNTLEIVATDAHRLYMSKKVVSSQVERLEILISEKTAKELSKIKGIGELHILPEGEIMVNGNVYSTFTDRNFVDYRVVVPEYDKAMQFDRVTFIDNCKMVLPHANKSTAQITLHLNGSIAMHTQDVDFSFESDVSMPYISKEFKDTDIAFNGNFLIECLSIFKDENIKMLSNGISTQASIFTNDNDTVLIMPLMLNQ